jgi:adenine-specific DNA methylase
MTTEAQINAILSNCDKDQLNKYLNSDEELEILIKSLDQYQSLVNEKENMILANKNLSESNLAKQPILDQAKKRLVNAIQEFDDARKEYLTVKESYDAVNAVNGDMSLGSVYSLLQTSATKAEEDTDQKADDFFCGSSSMHTEEEVNQFQRQFLEARTQAHIKKIKAEKMKELLPNY